MPLRSTALRHSPAHQETDPAHRATAAAASAAAPGRRLGQHQRRRATRRRPIVVGSANFPESELLAQIYGQAARRPPASTSATSSPSAPARLYFPAIESGEIDLVPEYTNSLLSFILARTIPRRPSATNVDRAAGRARRERSPRHSRCSRRRRAEDKDVIVCNAGRRRRVRPDRPVEPRCGAAPTSRSARRRVRDPHAVRPAGLHRHPRCDVRGVRPARHRRHRRPLSIGPDRLRQPVLHRPGDRRRGLRGARRRPGPGAQRGGAPADPRPTSATPEAVAVLDGMSAALDTEILTGLVAQVDHRPARRRRRRRRLAVDRPQPVPVRRPRAAPLRRPATPLRRPALPAAERRGDQRRRATDEHRSHRPTDDGY